MIIGIGGASRSGKSTFARLLINKFRNSGKTAIVLYLDDFVYSINQIPTIDHETDWESPQSINFDLLIQAVEFFKPHYDYIIIDGFLAYYHADLRQLCSTKIFLEIKKETFLARKKEDKRWGDVSESYMQHIWESYQRYGIPDFNEANYLRLSGEDPSLFAEFIENSF